MYRYHSFWLEVMKVISVCLNNKVERTAKTRNRYNQVSYLTRNAICESDKTQENITHKRAKKSAISQQVNNKAARNRQDSLTLRQT